MTRSATDLAKTANTRARMDGENMRFLVEVFVNGNRQWVQLDTGNAGPIYLSRRMAQEVAG